MIDDEDSKVRRNLVAFATVICSLAFLEIQPLGLMEEAMKHKLGSSIHVSPAKAWILSFTILTYLAIRYHFCSKPETEEVQQQRPGDIARGVTPSIKRVPISRSFMRVYTEQKLAVLQRILKRQVVRSRKSGQGGRYGSLHETSRRVVLDTLRGHAGEGNLPDGELSSITNIQIYTTRADFFSPISDAQIWAGIVRFNFVATVTNARGDASKVDSGCAVSFTASLVTRLETWVRSLWLATVFSRDGVSIIFPYLLAIAAYACIAWRLIQLVA